MANPVHNSSLKRQFPAEYRIWLAMRNRCYSASNRQYQDYGGRGINICDAWHNPDEFLRDMAPRPAPNLTLDRKDNNGQYSKENCRWITMTEQMFNSRKRKDGYNTCRGVYNKGSGWSTRGHIKGITYHLYNGPDFFLAVCARKSWENRNVS